MKIWTSEHVFDHPWETVVQAAWRKYPNPFNNAVTGIDTVRRDLTPADGVLRSKRVLMTEWRIPGWATRLIGLSNPSYSYEHSEVNPHDRTMLLKTVNLNCTNFVSVDEQLQYKQHPSDPERTILEQSTVLNVRGVPLISYMEDLISSIFRSNSHTGRQGMEWAIGRIKEEVEELASSTLHLSEVGAEITHRLEKEVSELGRNLSEEVTELGRNLEKEVTELGRNLEKEVTELGRNLEKEVSELSRNLTVNAASPSEQTVPSCV